VKKKKIGQERMVKSLNETNKGTDYAVVTLKKKEMADDTTALRESKKNASGKKVWVCSLKHEKSRQTNTKKKPEKQWAVGGEE